MSAAGLTAYKLYRTLWPQKAINEAVFKQDVELGLFKKDGTFYEKVRQIAVGTGGPQGISGPFATAKANKSASTAIEFTVATKPLYALWSLEGDLIRRSKNDKALLVDPIKRESQNSIANWRQAQCAYIHGNGGGALLRLHASTAVSGVTFTVLSTDVKKMRFIQPGMKLQTGSTDGTSGSVNAGVVTVATVNRSAGTFTVSEASILGAIPLAANSDYVFRDGTFGAVLNGFEAHNPASAPGATAFQGVDRTVDVDLLGGLRLTATTKTPRQAAKEAANLVADNWGHPDLYLEHTSDWANLEADLDSAGSLTRTTVAASPIGKLNFGVSYQAIQMAGPLGPIDIVASPNAPPGVGRMLTKSTWTLGYMGELLHDIETNDAEDSADATEFRMIGDVAFYTDLPGANCRVALV